MPTLPEAQPRRVPAATSLERFVVAQAGNAEVRVPYASALAEVRKGRKRSCWIWYVFPQFKGQRLSAMNERYQLRSVSEAAAYLQHPVLGARYLQIANAALGHLHGANAVQGGVEAVFGGLVDAVKFHQSVTSMLLTAAALAHANGRGTAETQLREAVAEDALRLLAAVARQIAATPYGSKQSLGKIDALEPAMVARWREIRGPPEAVEAAINAVSIAAVATAGS